MVNISFLRLFIFELDIILKMKWLNLFMKVVWYSEGIFRNLVIIKRYKFMVDLFLIFLFLFFNFVINWVIIFCRCCVIFII